MARPTPSRRRRRRAPWIVLAAFVVAAAALLAAVAVWSGATLAGDPSALARVEVQPLGGTLERARASAPDGTPIPLAVSHGRLTPRTLLTPGERVTVDVVIRRPGWLGWALGRERRERLTLRAPVVGVSSRWLTVKPGAGVRVRFDGPVTSAAYGTAGRLRHKVPGSGRSVTLGEQAAAGTVDVAAAARSWERLGDPVTVSWFPPAASPVALVSPAPATRLSPVAPIRLTFSQPVADVLGSDRPKLTPSAPGRWRRADSHTLVFAPSGLGFPLEAHVALELPRPVAVTDGHAVPTKTTRRIAWTVPGGSVLRLQQLLAQLGYLPLGFKAAQPVARTPEAEIAAAITPPAGTFAWRWKSTPQQLRELWEPGQDSIMTRGALMAFERDHDLTTDGLAGPRVWQTLLQEALHPKPVTPNYTYVMVRRDGQSLSLWHDGSVIITSPVNTGITAAPTNPGTFAVFEHLRSTTMSGTNPDGSHYSDPGVPWVSYFNGGDALHGFPRGTYGVPQSLGCVELPIDTAGRIWPYTDVGTLVTVA
jgi:peptidoglycan hydrolase-like protein with peptidoglycan-binding domain